MSTVRPIFNIRTCTTLSKKTKIMFYSNSVLSDATSNLLKMTVSNVRTGIKSFLPESTIVHHHGNNDYHKNNAPAEQPKFVAKSLLLAFNRFHNLLWYYFC